MDKEFHVSCPWTSPRRGRKLHGRTRASQDLRAGPRARRRPGLGRGHVGLRASNNLGQRRVVLSLSVRVCVRVFFCLLACLLACWFLGFSGAIVFFLRHAVNWCMVSRQRS